jgi:ketosteroid isomerase-like protein
MPQTKARTAALLASADDVEAQFYEALASGDIERLMALWSEDDEVACVHPGGPRIVGHAAVRASFELSRPAWLPGGQLQTIWPALHARR